MADAPKRKMVSRLVLGRPGQGYVETEDEYVRADIADGYREALEDIAKILADPPKTAWIKIDTAAALAREALAKGDEA